MFKNNQVKIQKLIPDSIQDMLKEHLNIEVDTTQNLSESQKVAFNIFKEGKNLVILGSAGCGKCHGIDTPILMFDGTIKRVQDIVIGDFLMGDDSEPRHVLSLSRGKDTMFKVTNTKKESYIVNSNHVLSLKINNDVVDIPIKDYIKLDPNIKKYLKGYKVGVKFVEFMGNFPDVDYYELGVNTGDGMLKQKKNSKCKPCNNKYAVNGVAFSEYNIPFIYRCSTRENRLKFLAGVIDSNGNLIRDNSKYEFSQYIEHKQMINDVTFIARSLGFSCYMNENDKLWRVCILGKGVDDIPTKIKRKPVIQENVLELNITVEELPISDYYGFEVTDNHRYVMGDFTVTHNSCIIKSMEEYIKMNKKDTKIYLCSTTGISAYNIGGMTIHSFMGIGTGDIDVDALIRKVNRKKKYKDRIISTDILVIDEVSMLSAELFEKLNLICQAIRKSKQFFGGIQIILTGDLNQLIPIFNRNIEFTKGEEQDTRLIIESPEFTKEFNKKNGNIIVLKENFRQKNDPTFINLLLRIREGKHTEEDINVLKSRLNIKPVGKTPVNLVSSNKSAQIINDSNVSKIKEPVNKYTTIYKDSGKEPEVDELLIKELKFQFKQKGIDTLELRKSTRVMLTKNLDTSIGLVNGSIGTIESFIQVENSQEYPVVMFDNGIKQLISPVSIELELDGCKASATQIPLMLAYAITIHRSQSLTLDSAVLDLAECFADAQIYVALSRVRSLDGIYLTSFNPAKIKVNKKMTDYLNNL